MATKYHQISLSDIFSDYQNSFIDDSTSFFSLLSEHFDLNEFIPSEFLTAFYLSIGRKRLYPLQGFLTAFILQKIFSIPTDSLLLLFLHLTWIREVQLPLIIERAEFPMVFKMFPYFLFSPVGWSLFLV